MIRSYACIALSCILLMGCEFLSSSDLEVVNRSGKPLEDVAVSFTGKHQQKKKSIAPGASEHFGSHDYGEGAITVEFWVDRRRRSYDIGYLTPRASLHCTVYVFDQFVKHKCRYGVI